MNLRPHLTRGLGALLCSLALASGWLATVAGCGDATSDTAAVPTLPPGSCPAGELDCGTGCVDPQTDASHCGSCGLGCEAGQPCHGGQCGAPCTDECTSDGAEECFVEGVRQCGNHDVTDGCLEWSAVEPCPDGLTCDPATVTCREPCRDHCDPFSIVLLPDTQYYTSKQGDNADNTYYKQAQWIVDHQDTDSIEFVIHLGDITNNNYDSQWQIADKAHGILDAAGVPYSVLPGNHDYFTANGFDRGESGFDDYFGPDRFVGKPWYGGGYGSGNTNNYTFFEVGPTKFMVLSLEYSPRKDVLCWAEQLIADHPEHRVIIATHCYQTHGGGYSPGCPDPDYLTVGSDGATVWSELASRYSNVFLVVAGHIGDSEYRLTPGNAGNGVHEMLVDYQFEGECHSADPSNCNDSCRAGTYTGNGWLRLLTFDPRANRVYADTITVEDGNTGIFPAGDPVMFCSPLFDPTDPAADGGNWYSDDPMSTEHVFDFSYDMTSPLAATADDLGRRTFLDRTVNSAGAGDQLGPKVALSPSGSFVAVWEDDSSAADGAGNFDIMVRGFAPGGCSAFADRLVPTATAGQQQMPAVAADADGNFVVAWADDQDDNSVFQIHARGFAADGSERFPLFTVNSVAAGQQLYPAIAMAPDGRFVVAWEDGGNGQEQIWMRGFAADGSERFADRSVHSDAVGQRIAPTVGLDANANIVVAWQDDSDGNGTYQIHARGFDASGAERFARMTVNSQAAGEQRNPTLGVSAAGAFVVAWEDDQDNNGNYVILARGFGANGAATLPDFRVHAAAGGQHRWPTLSAAPDGTFAVGWQDDGDGNGSYQIRARTFLADGAEWMAEWTVNRVPDGQQLAPHVGLSASGTFVALWEDDMDGNDAFQILARGLDSP